MISGRQSSRGKLRSVQRPAKQSDCLAGPAALFANRWPYPLVCPVLAKSDRNKHSRSLDRSLHPADCKFELLPAVTWNDQIA